MPSSMIFVGLVVIWLLILVPAVARHRQEVARPSTAALSGRVLERPRRRQSLEVDEVDEAEADERPQVATAEVDDHGVAAPVDEADDDLRRAADDRRWQRPPPRYRRGRGGFDPEAAALAARARYAFRQRVVLTMLITAVISAIVALVASPTAWWVHGSVDVALICYLGYLRRQVRMEEAIRQRRAARMAGTRRESAAEDPELDEWARRGREATRRIADTVPSLPAAVELPPEEEPFLDDADQQEEPEVDADPAEPALPRLQPAPPPPLPAGTAVVEATDDDPDLYDLDIPTRPDYRRAVGE